jgi:hypothetical protein
LEGKRSKATGRAKGSKPRAGRKAATAKSAPVKDVVSVDITADVADIVDDVVDVTDPLAGLVARTKEDPSAPFAPEVLSALSELKKSDKRAFESLRAQLKRAGCRISSLEESLSEELGAGPTARTQSQADILLRLVQGVELFHAADMTAYADLIINDHRETWPVKSKGFSRWLARAFYEDTRGAAGSEAMQAALNVIKAKAHHDAVEREAHVRIARLGGKLYVDLCDKAWCAIEIDADGWRVVDAPPVRFKRASGALELPVPVSGGSIDDLLPFFNLRNKRDFILVVAWALAALIDTGPYPALAFTGEQGVAKSTASKILRMLIDPNSAPLRALPRSDLSRQLAFAGVRQRVRSAAVVVGYAVQIIERRRIRGAFALHQHRRSAVQRVATDHPQWHRRHYYPSGPRRPRIVHWLGADLGRRSQGGR